MNESKGFNFDSRCIEHISLSTRQVFKHSLRINLGTPWILSPEHYMLLHMLDCLIVDYVNPTTIWLYILSAREYLFKSDVINHDLSLPYVLDVMSIDQKAFFQALQQRKEELFLYYGIPDLVTNYTSRKTIQRGQRIIRANHLNKTGERLRIALFPRF